MDEKLKKELAAHLDHTFGADTPRGIIDYLESNGMMRRFDVVRFLVRRDYDRQLADTDKTGYEIRTELEVKYSVSSTFVTDSLYHYKAGEKQ